LCNFTIPVHAKPRQRFLQKNMVLKEQYQLRKIQKGDIASFEQLFHRFYAGLFAYARSLVRSNEISEEIVQDVFYNIWKNRETLRIQRSWQSYLYRSVYNNSMMHFRKSHREIPMDESYIPDPVSGWPDPGEDLQYRELSEWVTHTMEALPERTREIFLLNREEGLKYREIALRLSISEKTVEAHMGKALKALRSSLEKYRQV
jgi:RNA polymerase sigma-70 factor (ECF subfamily)